MSFLDIFKQKKDYTLPEFLQAVDDDLDKILEGNSTDLIYSQWFTYQEDDGTARIGIEDARFKEESEDEPDFDIDITSYFEDKNPQAAARFIVKEIEAYIERNPDRCPSETSTHLDFPTNTDDEPDDYEGEDDYEEEPDDYEDEDDYEEEPDR